MATLRIEDDDDQLKVPRDQIPPVRPTQKDAADAGATAQSAARQLIATPSVSTTAPAANATRQIPGLALRASLAKSTGSRKDTP